MKFLTVYTIGSSYKKSTRYAFQYEYDWFFHKSFDWSLVQNVPEHIFGSQTIQLDS